MTAHPSPAGVVISTGLCTCHNPPRPMTQQNTGEEWAHDDTEDYAEVFHVHAYSRSVDCDGPLDRERTYQLTSLRDVEDKGDLWSRLVRMEVCPHGIQTVNITEGHCAEFNQLTDEGFSAVTLQGCTDPNCAHDRASQRDHYAEAMGY